MAERTDPKLIEEIDSIITDVTEPTPDQADPDPVETNGGPYGSHSEPVPAK